MSIGKMNTDAATFRSIARKRQLILEDSLRSSEDIQKYFFDLNSGEIVTRRDDNLVWELLKLSKETYQECGYEVHFMLELVAERGRINSPGNVCWFRPYLHRRSTVEYISLSEYLESHGFDLDEIRLF